MTRHRRVLGALALAFAVIQPLGAQEKAVGFAVRGGGFNALTNLNEAGTADFKQPGKHRVKGTRRALRVKPTDVKLEGGVDEHGPHVTIAFTLPAGSFATVFLRELMKSDAKPKGPEAGQDEGEENASESQADEDLVPAPDEDSAET